MKLRNKKTKEINILKVDEDYFNIYKDDGEFVCPVTLKELNDGWEDYEEPKEYWYIDYEGGILVGETDNSPAEKMMKSIGNHFNTLSEAEKAVEKLKSWKRLKDNGFKFDEWKRDKEFSGDYIIKASDYHTCDDKDLDLLFGGEE